MAPSPIDLYSPGGTSVTLCTSVRTPVGTLHPTCHPDTVTGLVGSHLYTSSKERSTTILISRLYMCCECYSLSLQHVKLTLDAGSACDASLKV